MNNAEGLRRAQQVLASGHMHPAVDCLAAFELNCTLEPTDLQAFSSKELNRRFDGGKFTLQRRQARLADTRYEARDEAAALEPVNDLQAARRQTWLEQVDGFTLRDCLLFLVHRRLSVATLDDYKVRPSEVFKAQDAENQTIEFRFGTDKYQQGYYDNPQAPELRTLPASPVTALRRRQRTIDTLRSLAYRNGFDLGINSDDTNISFWHQTEQGPRSAHNLETSEGIAMTVRIAAGMLNAVRSANAAYVDRQTLEETQGIHTYSIGHGRMNTLRIMPDRFELRIGYGMHETAERKLQALLAGFAFGATHAEPAFTVLQSNVPKFEAAASFDKDRDLHILRAAEHSVVDRHGYLRLSADYAAARGSHILKSLVGYKPFDIFFGLTKAVSSIVGTIQLQGDALRVDKVALSQWRDAALPEDLYVLEKYCNANLNPAHINRRLQTVRANGMRPNIAGMLPNQTLTTSTLSQALQEYGQASILNTTIPPHVRQQDITERFAWSSGFAG